MDNKMKYKWVAAIPLICTIVYFVLAYCLDKFTNNNKPYLTSLVVYIVVPFEYYIVGLKKFKFVYPVLISVLYLTVCALLEGVFSISLWHPLWVIFITIPIYYIFVGDKKIENKAKDFTDKVKTKYNKEKLDPNDCDFDSSK